MSFPVQQDTEHRRCVVGDEAMIFHCHHYNAFLQRSILDARSVDSVPVLVGAGAEVAHHQLARVYAETGLRDVAERKRVAAELYRWAGFGTIDLSSLNERGGTMSTPSSHYAMAWRVKFGRSEVPVCYFAAGWIAGALAAIHDLPNGSFRVQETACAASTEARPCSFTLAREPANYSVFPAVGVGSLSTHRPRPIPDTGVDYDGIFGAVSSMPLVGDAEGNIPAFGVFLTRHYANYYCRVSYELERTLHRSFGAEGLDASRSLFVEAGHVCAFNTFGGIMTSTEWDALIRPNLKSREDWVHGMVAVANTLGWGRWQVTRVSEREAEFVVHDDYESVGYLAMYGQSDHPVSYLAEGGVIGLMDLVYLGNIQAKPELSEAFYRGLFRGDGSYRAECLSSRAMGDEVTAFRVYRPA